MTTTSITRRALPGTLTALVFAAAPAAAHHPRPATDTFLLAEKRMEVYHPLGSATWNNDAHVRVTATTTRPGKQGEVCVHIQDPAAKFTEQGCGPATVAVPDNVSAAETYGAIPSTYTIGGRKPRSGSATIRLYYVGEPLEGPPFQWCYHCSWVPTPDVDRTERLLWGWASAWGSYISSTSGFTDGGGSVYAEAATPRP